MTAPSARLPTSPSKRSRSLESLQSFKDALAHEPPSKPGDRVPAFLRQAKLEIHGKFEELEWQQQMRISQGRNDSDPSSQWAQETTQEVRARNRYINVQAWANSRIHLRVPEGHCDYINASPVLLRNSKTGKEMKYIATQGPKEAQLSHIWHMIWHETIDVAVIVMLTQVSEGGRDKCFQYFPLDSTKDTLTINEADEFGDGFKASIQLLELTTDERKRTTVRKLRMTVGDESRIIWHLLFSGWPDFGVPECDDRLALFELLKLSAEKNAKPENPRIIHCSAGVGRSGTFIALDHLLGELDAGTIADTKDNEDIVFDTVNELRKQRMMMVQSDTQYIFLYEVLRERLEESLTNSSAKTFESYEERSPKVARLEKDIDAGTTETSGETTDAISMSPIDGS